MQELVQSTESVLFLQSENSILDHFGPFWTKKETSKQIDKDWQTDELDGLNLFLEVKTIIQLKQSFCSILAWQDIV